MMPSNSRRRPEDIPGRPGIATGTGLITMPDGTESESRKLLGRLRDTMAEEAAGQERLDKITHLTADSMGTEVCSIYLFRDEHTLELCATEGLRERHCSS